MTDHDWSAQHERQYLHLRGGLLERGLPESLAEEIAARAIHQVRARQAEPADAKDRSLANGAARLPGGLQPHPGRRGKTLLQLRSEARRRGLPGRSTMNKAQLESALAR